MLPHPNMGLVVFDRLYGLSNRGNNGIAVDTQVKPLTESESLRLSDAFEIIHPLFMQLLMATPAATILHPATALGCRFLVPLRRQLV